VRVSQPRLRCRLGLHRWVRVQYRDGDLEQPVPEWRTECRDCARLRGSGLPTAIAVFGIFFVTGLVLMAWGPPFLGALFVAGSMAGLGWTAGLEGLQRVARWLSIGR
jgi:hypothetical protein